MAEGTTAKFAPTRGLKTRDPAPPAWAKELARLHGFELLSAHIENVRDVAPAEFEQRTRDAYCAMAQKLRAAKLHPVRFWNHVPFITEPADAVRDNYMVFNAGRFAAFESWLGGRAAFDREVATASATGHWASDLVIHCLASSRVGAAVNNPRQVAPYHYSQRFGPLPPCFARATRLAEPRGLLLVGGTASVRGEDSVHMDHVAAQLRETFVNLAALVGAAAGKKPREVTLLGAFTDLRAYYPDLTHAAEIQAAVRAAFPSLRRLEMFHADLCRKELLVEIEGLADLNQLG